MHTSGTEAIGGGDVSTEVVASSHLLLLSLRSALTFEKVSVDPMISSKTQLVSQFCSSNDHILYQSLPKSEHLHSL